MTLARRQFVFALKRKGERSEYKYSSHCDGEKAFPFVFLTPYSNGIEFKIDLQSTFGLGEIELAYSLKHKLLVQFWLTFRRVDLDPCSRTRS